MRPGTSGALATVRFTYSTERNRNPATTRTCRFEIAIPTRIPMTFRSDSGMRRSLIAVARAGMKRLATAAAFAGSIIFILGEPTAHAQESRSLDLGAQHGSYACAINSNGMAVGVKD